MYILAGPLAMLIRPIYDMIQSYGWTLVIVTVLINLLTIPLTVISQKSTAKTQQIQPLINELQRKYANDKEKFNTEMQKIYTKYGINPMSGCFPLIIRLLIILGFVGVVYNPLQYILRLSPDQINAIRDAVSAAGGKITYQVQYCGRPEAIDYITKLGKEPINFNFMGIDLTKMLSENMSDIKIWIIPVLAVLATVASSFLTKKMMAAANPNGQAMAGGNTMLYFMPVMTAYFTYIMPIGMSLYWFTSTIINMGQQFITNIIMKNNQKELPLTPNDKKRLESARQKASDPNKKIDEKKYKK